MKFLLNVFVAAGCFISPCAEAVIGFSKERCDKIYKSKPLIKKSGSFKMVVYHNERATTACLFYGGKCVGVLIEDLGMSEKQGALVLTLNLERGEEISDLKRIEEIKNQKVYKSPSGRHVTYSGDTISIVTPKYYIVKLQDDVLEVYRSGKPNPYKKESIAYRMWKALESQKVKKQK